MIYYLAAYSYWFSLFLFIEKVKVNPLKVRSARANRPKTIVFAVVPASGRLDGVAVGVFGVTVALNLGVGVGVPVGLTVGVGLEVGLVVGVAEGVETKAGSSAA